MKSIDIALVLDKIRPGAAWRMAGSYEQLTATWEDKTQKLPTQQEIIDAWTAMTTPQPPSLADAQAVAWTAIKSERDRHERLPLDYLGKQLDFDALSSDRLTWAIAAARSAIAEGKADFKLEWTCADNSPMTMTAQQIVDLPTAVAQRSDGLHRRARELRAAIDAAKTVEDLQKVVW